MTQTKMLMHVVALSLTRLTWHRIRDRPALMGVLVALALFYVSHAARPVF